MITRTQKGITKTTPPCQAHPVFTFDKEGAVASKTLIWRHFPCKCSVIIDSHKLHDKPVRQGNSIISIFWMRKWNHREVKQLAQGCTASKWQCWDSNLGNLNPEFMFSTIIFFFFFFLAFFFWLFRAAPAAYGGSQARGPSRAIASGLCHSHSNAGSKPRLQPIPQLLATLDP